MPKTRSGTHHRNRQIRRPVRLIEQDVEEKPKAIKPKKYANFLRRLPAVHKYPNESELDVKQVRAEYEKLRARVSYLEKNNRDRQYENNLLLKSIDVQHSEYLEYSNGELRKDVSELHEKLKPTIREMKVSQKKARQLKRKVKRGEPSDPTKECSICTLEYEASHVTPRITHCGHTFCEGCIDHLLNQFRTLQCPTCRTVSNSVNRASQLPVNYFALGGGQ